MNFAVHLQVLDRIFGTFHLPKGRWPGAYGLAGGERVPAGYLPQLVEPFRVVDVVPKE